MVQSNDHKKCLLIIPKTFYSYTNVIRKELKNRGYDVIVSNHEYPDSVIGKIMGKLKIPLLLKITNKFITSNFLNVSNYDIVLIIKGRGMSKLLIENLSKISTKVVGYNFDSFEYNSAPLKWYKFVNQFYTFDYRDSENYNLPIVELFTSLPENSKNKEFKYDISAILRNHSDRLKFVDKVFNLFPKNKKFVYIYEQNIFTFLQNIVRNPFLYLKYYKYIFFKSLSYQEYTDVLHNSDFTVDCVHPSQSGISIRCFEALSSQTKIITNNPYVLKFQHFNKNNSIIITATTDNQVLQNQYNYLSKKLPEKHRRTISSFINDLIA